MSAKIRYMMMSAALLVGVSLVGCAGDSVLGPDIVDTSDRELLEDSDEPRGRGEDSREHDLEIR